MVRFSMSRCGLAFLFLLFPSVFGYPNQQEEAEGIYMCTKDVDRPESLVSEKSISGDLFNDSAVFLPFEGVEQSGKQYQFGRHCFMLRAKYNGIVFRPDGTSRLNLVKLNSYAFGKDDGKTATYEEKLVGLPKNMAISCTLLINEDDLSREAVSEEVNLIKKEVCNDGFCYNNLNKLEKIARLELIRQKWDRITRKMELETLRPYDLEKHNCCSVAYKGAATLFGDDENKVREKVNPQTFNVYGMGVVWSNYELTRSWSLGESSRSSFRSAEETEVDDVSANMERNVDETKELETGQENL